jgi:head-tail adaptor
MIAAGSLDQAFEVLEPVVSADGWGTDRPSFQSKGHLRGRLVRDEGGELMGPGLELAERRLTFETHFTTLVGTADRIEWGGLTLEVVSVTGTRRDRRSIITAREVQSEAET